MLFTKFFTIVKAVRLRYAVPFVVLLVALYLTVIHPWMVSWGSTAAERQMTLPGDNLHPNSSGHSTKALTINAPSDVVWQWLVQIGQNRAGFYTYTWLENLFGADIHNTNEIRPEWQQLSVGDVWRLAPPDYLWGLGGEMASPVLISEPGYALVLEMFGAHVILPVNENTSRLIVRGEVSPTNLITMMVADPVVFTLERRMLLGLKARAEGRPDAPVVLMAITQFGWAATGVSVAGLFLSQRRRRYWLVLPIVAALPALLATSDIQAALAAFIAAGIILLGFLFFGRNWWGSIIIIGSVVLLTLLLAPEAYTALGMAFTLLILATLSLMVAGRSRTAESTKHQSAVPIQ